MKVDFNVASPKLGVSFPQPSEKDFETESFKYRELNRAYDDSNEYVRRILEAMPIANSHKHVLVDVKSGYLHADEYTCIPGWHCDTVENPLHDSVPEKHHLLVTGHHALTEFIGEPISLLCNKDSSLKDLRLQISDDVIVNNIPTCTIASYGRFDFHRGPRAKMSGKRMLIRVTETDVVRPTIQQWKQIRYRGHHGY